MAVPRKRAEILIAAALRNAAFSALDRYMTVGDVTPSDITAAQLARVLSRIWRMSIKSEGRKVMRAINDLQLKQAEDDLWRQFVEEYIRLYGGQAIADILDTTRKQIIEAVQKGLADGKGVDQIAKEVREALPGMTRLRSAIIARTETHSAAQFASLETAKRSRFPLVKVWNSVVDPRTRDFGEGDGKADQANHRAMNGVTVPLSEPFMVPNKWGGFDPLHFCGDPAAPAYQIVNCRCSLSYKRAARIS